MSDSKKKAKGRLGGLISMVCFLIIGIGAGIAMIPVLTYFLDEGGNFFVGVIATLIMVALAYLAVMIEMVIHEAGHLVFGLATGYSFVSFRIGSFIITREEGKFRFGRFSLPGTGGQCLMEMKDYSPSYPFFLYNAGGAIFNFLSFLLFLLLFFILMDLPFLSSFFLMTSFVSLGLGAMNIIPLIYGNDGSNIIAIRRSEIDRKCFWSQMKMAALQSKGVRLKDMDMSVFPVERESEVTSSMSAAALSYLHSRLLDEKKVEEARKVGEEALSSIHQVPLLRSMLKVDLLYEYLMMGESKEKISFFKDKTLIGEMKKMRGLLSVMRTEYAYALLFEGNEEKAENIRKAFVAASSTYPYRGEVEGEEELMDEALKKYRSL